MRRPDFLPTVAAIATAILLLIPTASAQITSTSSGGAWGDTSTWVGGTVPTEADDVVISAGGAVTVSGNTEMFCRNLTVEAGGSLTGSVAYRTVVAGNLLNRGTITGFLDFVVLGTVRNEGTLGGEDDNSMWIYAYGNIQNHGSWGGRLNMAGDRRRTVRAHGVEADISVARSFFYIDPIPPRILLDGQNYFPNFRLPVRGGDLVVVAPGGTFEVESDAFDAPIDYEHGYWLNNYGRIPLLHRNVSDAAPGHGATFELSDGAAADSIRVISYGHQVPATFANAVRRWWQVDTWPSDATGSFDRIRMEFTPAEATDAPLEHLELYHSADAGVTWDVVSDAEISASTFLTVRDETYTEVIATGSFPLSGRYTVAPNVPAAARPSVTAQIIGRNQIRVGGPAAEYLIIYENTGEMPLYEGLLRIDTEGGAYIDHIITSNPSPIAREPVVIHADTFSLYNDSTSAMLMTPRLAPGESRTLSVFLKAVPVDDADKSALKKPLALPAVALAVAKGIAAGYLVDLAAHALEETAADPCMTSGGLRDKLGEAFDRTDDKWNPFGDSESPWLTTASNGASALAEDGLLKEGLGRANALNDLKTMADGLTKGFDRYESNHGSIFKPVSCDEDPPPRGPEGDRRRKDLDPVNSFDPNAKVGPGGAGARGFISSGGTFTYQIQFENLAEATAPAYRVVIVDTLADAFLAETVQRTRESHPGFQFTRDGNILRWEVEGIELPPNVTPPEGEGFVEFTVDTRRDLPSGSELANRAEIVFDLNEPILTNVHLNTLDVLPPTTSMIPLAPTTSGDSLDVSWTVDDGEDGSGVATTTLFVSRDGGLFAPLGMTTGTSLRVGVASGHTYAFYAMSRDQAGNTESAAPDAVQTSVTVSSAGETPFRFALHPAYPNPFNPTTNVAFEVAATGRVTLRIYNVLGQRLSTIDLGRLAPGVYERQIDLAPYASGLYFYELRVDGPTGSLFRAVEKAMLIK